MRLAPDIRRRRVFFRFTSWALNLLRTFDCFAPDPDHGRPVPPRGVLTPTLLASAAASTLRDYALREGVDLSGWTIGVVDQVATQRTIHLVAVDPDGNGHSIEHLATGQDDGSALGWGRSWARALLDNCPDSAQGTHRENT